MTFKSPIPPSVAITSQVPADQITSAVSAISQAGAVDTLIKASPVAIVAIVALVVGFFENQYEREQIQKHIEHLVTQHKAILEKREDAHQKRVEEMGEVLLRCIEGGGLTEELTTNMSSIQQDINSIRSTMMRRSDKVDRVLDKMWQETTE